MILSPLGTMWQIYLDNITLKLTELSSSLNFAPY